MEENKQKPQRGGGVVLHLALIAGIIGLFALCVVYPFLPGDYDEIAAPLAMGVQVVGAVAVLLVPIGGLWLIYEARKRARTSRSLPFKARGYLFGLVSLIAASLLAGLVCFVIFMAFSKALGVLILALWVYLVYRLRPGLRQLKGAEASHFNPAPLYLVLLPIGAVIVPLTLAPPVLEMSRNQAIANSDEMISEIEAHYEARGSYPTNLQALNVDYRPAVVGIEQYHYAPNGEAYNLFFQQPEFLLHNFGTREIVMYNKLDEHVMPSHAVWILIWTPEELAAQQGWYAAHDAATPHWKYFWFD